jgi:tetratricopeptide (TPR) repeat protein
MSAAQHLAVAPLRHAQGEHNGAGTASVLVALARQHAQAGRWQDAAALYQQALQYAPEDAGLYNALGMVRRQQGHLEAAVVCYEAALRRQPQAVALHFNLGNAYQAQGKLAEAVAQYQQGLQLAPAHAEGWCNLGQALASLGDSAAAVALLRRAIQLQPQCAPAWNSLGQALLAQGRLAAAITVMQQALQHCPGSPEMHNTLGVMLLEQGEVARAADHFQAALRLQPDYAEVHTNLGNALRRQGRFAEAIAHHHRVLQLQPTCAAAYHNLGAVLQAQGDLPAALTAYQAALQLSPTSAAAHYNMGTVYQELAELEAALQCYTAAIQLQPAHAKAQWNRALVWLMLGALSPGWQAYEWRGAALGWPVQECRQPRWNGTALAGRSIVVQAEQGLGDEILFASCCPDLLRHAGRVVLTCDARLASLFARSFPTARVREASRQPHSGNDRSPRGDVYSLAGSLARYLRPTLGHFPLHRGYLVPEASRQEHWQTRLAALGPGLRLGIAWRSLASRPTAPYYTQLCQWRPVLRLPGIHWVNLQYDDCETEIATVEQQWGVTIQRWADLDVFTDLDGVAALMGALDLVIAPATMVAQLAASIGTPVWRLSSYAHDEMFLGTDVVPWFPTMRVYRQPAPGDWQTVFTQLATDLLALLARQPA